MAKRLGDRVILNFSNSIRGVLRQELCLIKFHKFLAGSSLG
mgnify:CR=1 FL=1